MDVWTSSRPTEWSITVTIRSTREMLLRNAPVVVLAVGQDHSVVCAAPASPIGFRIHPQHAPHPRRELGLLDVQCLVGGELSLMATGAQIVGAEHAGDRKSVV